jgi:hypothetical protein
MAATAPKRVATKSLERQVVLDGCAARERQRVTRGPVADGDAGPVGRGEATTQASSTLSPRPEREPPVRADPYRTSRPADPESHPAAERARDVHARARRAEPATRLRDPQLHPDPVEAGLAIGHVQRPADRLRRKGLRSRAQQHEHGEHHQEGFANRGWWSSEGQDATPSGYALERLYARRGDGSSAPLTCGHLLPTPGPNGPRGEGSANSAADDPIILPLS